MLLAYRVESERPQRRVPPTRSRAERPHAAGEFAGLSDVAERLWSTEALTRIDRGGGGLQVSHIAPVDTLEALQYLHAKLDTHFRRLRDQRLQLEPTSPVFALEHDLSSVEIELLKSAVRSGIQDFWLGHFRKTWLPFVVYAAEMGYGYEGDEYWTTFSNETPRWTERERSTIRDWFRRFGDEYAGARPTGAWARQFTIIAWPITHAVLPVYLQRQFAKLLYEFRTGLTSELLTDPDKLGARLASRAGWYSDRFRQFAQNTALVGQVGVALLAGGDNESPYLTKATLDRLVQGLSDERQARHWLSSARHEASRVRGSGFRSSDRQRSRSARQRLPRATDPRFVLRFIGGSWNAYAKFPDLTPISERLPDVFEEMRTLRARVQGGSRVVASGGLTDAGQEVRLQTWPDPAKPFVQLENGSEWVNGIIADQCVMTSGPWWLFRLQESGAAIEIKGRSVRPGHRYILVGASDQAPPAVDWCRPTELNVSGVNAFRLEVPEQLTESDAATLVEHGVSSVSSVLIRPVGIVASSWDGEGAGEWLAGEPAILGIRSELHPATCLISLDGEFFQSIPWPEREMELVLSFTNLSVGEHEVTASLGGAEGQDLTSGTLAIAVRDPLVRPENATVGEGIRMLATPARPTMAELWDERASITVDGPAEAEAELVVSLRDEWGVEKRRITRKLVLPVDGTGWRQHAQSIRDDKRFKDVYDEAESCALTVHRDSVGMASLTCERGFRPFRWRFRTERDGRKVASLSDRTDGGSTRVEFYKVDSPLQYVECDRTQPIPMPSRGGLLRAVSDEAESVVLAPTNPNDLLATRSTAPHVGYVDKSLAGVMKLVQGHRLWATADLPADAFAIYQQHLALDAVARALAMLLGGSHWAAIERKLVSADDPADLLDEMQRKVGNAPAHEALAEAISLHLYHWLTAGEILVGFSSAIHTTLTDSGIDVAQHPSAARFVLTLAGRPGWIMDWPESERRYLLPRVMSSPVLVRAARFAVLGTRILNDVESIERSF